MPILSSHSAVNPLAPIDMQVIRYSHNGKSKGYGFVSFGDQIEGVRVIKEMTGKYVGESAAGGPNERGFGVLHQGFSPAQPLPPLFSLCCALQPAHPSTLVPGRCCAQPSHALRTCIDLPVTLAPPCRQPPRAAAQEPGRGADSHGQEGPGGHSGLFRLYLSQ